MLDFDSNIITLVYGNSATGKTTLCLQTALSFAKNNKVLFIDAENSFSVERLKQMDKEYEIYLNNIIIVKLNNFEEQNKIFENIEEMVKTLNIKIIIFDTIGMHYRFALQNENYLDVNNMLLSHLKKLKKICRDFNIPILITNQVYTNMVGKNIGVGGNMLACFGRRLIELKNNPRVAVFIKPEKKIVSFELIDQGLRTI